MTSQLFEQCLENFQSIIFGEKYAEFNSFLRILTCNWGPYVKEQMRQLVH